MADEKKRITAYPTASSLGDDDYVMIDNGGANGTKKFKAKDLGGGSRTVELIVGDLTGTYTASAPTYVLPTTATALPTGKHWLDYDELIIVVVWQMTPTSSSPERYTFINIPTFMLQTGNNIGDFGVNAYQNFSNQGVRVNIFTDDRYQTDWYNYASPIAILGVKY